MDWLSHTLTEWYLCWPGQTHLLAAARFLPLPAPQFYVASSFMRLCWFSPHASFWVILPTELYPAGIKTSTWNMLWDVHPVSCLKGQQSWQGDVTCLNGSYLAMSFSFIFFFFLLPMKKVISNTRKRTGYLLSYECLLAVHLWNANEHLCCLVWTDCWPWRNYWCCSWMKLFLTF